MLETKRLVESSILIAMAMMLEILSRGVPLQLPFGGGVTIVSMLPIVILGYKFGVKWGLICGFAYSVIQMMMGVDTLALYFMNDEMFPFSSAVLVTLLDYTLATTVLGLSGIFKNKLKSRTTELLLGCVFAMFLTFMAHFISGFLFWGSYAEWFFTQDGMGAVGEWVLSTFTGFGLSVFYSFVYNASYMSAEILITTIVASAIIKIPSLYNKITE